MATYIPGQRWFSTAEPELGLGTVLRVEPRQVQIVYPASGTLRHYAQASAPLLRARFNVGEQIQVRSLRLRVEAVRDEDGLLLYRAGDEDLPEGALDDVQPFSHADQRLVSGRVDSNAAFALRLEALQRRAEARASAAFGVLSARIDLIPHQLRVAQAANARRPPRALLADEVGLGKTIEAGLILARQIATGRAGRVLVLAPPALVYQWFVELKRRFNLAFAIYDEERAESIELEGGGRNPFGDDQLVLTDLAFLLGPGARAEQAVDAGWDLIVVDEAHHLAWSPEQASPEYALVERLAQASPGLILLTATPEQLGRTGHFARLRLLDPARFHALDEYQRESEHYLALSRLAERIESGAVLERADHEELAHLLDQDPEAGALLGRAAFSPEQCARLIERLVDRHGTGRVMFRNRRAGVGGFPARRPELEVLPLPERPGFAEQLHEEFQGDLASPPWSPPLSYAEDPRLAWLLALLAGHPDDKFLLICRSQPKLHALEEALRLRSGVALARFHEGLGIVQRDRNAAYFAQTDGARLLLATEIGSEGRNFQFAHRLVLWDLPVDPDLLEQRIGRLDRIGQRHEIAIHVAAFEGSPQHALMRWYDEGMDGFRQSPEDGRELLKRLGGRVVEIALRAGRADGDGGAELEELIADTRTLHAELASRIAQGRDRLLELAARRAAPDEALREALRTADADRNGDAFVERLLEQFGVTIDEHGERTVLLDPELSSNEPLPGLEEGPREATFDRATALSREELPFLRADHPLVQAALDLMLSGERGNAAFLVDTRLPQRTALLEAVYVLECVAASQLDVERFLPPQPIRAACDTRLVERPDYRVDAEQALRMDERPVDAARYRKVLAKLVPAMLAACERAASARAQAPIAAAAERADTVLSAEIERLGALARVNPGVRPEEIAAAQLEHTGLLEAIAAARLRLDAVRLVVSRDFLGLG
jgi:ATP-dependent helicase HepA